MKISTDSLVYTCILQAHRRTVTLERQHLLDSENDDMAELISTSTSTLDNTTSNNMQQQPHPPSPTTIRSQISHPLSPSSALRRRRYSFLQHLAVDDVLLRIFEFIDCSSLVKTGTTCHRFRELSKRSAEQRTQRLADGRLLKCAMKMLRAQEQIEGVGPREGNAGPYVPIPMLGLSRRVKVSGCGDPEFNGIYFCTGSNGNGFLFTKPRSPERRARNPPSLFSNMQQQLHLDGVQGNAEENDAPGGGGGGGIVGLVNENNAIDVNVDVARQDNSVDVLFGDEPNRSRLLRCVIAKRFSNEVSCDELLQMKCLLNKFHTS